MQPQLLYGKIWYLYLNNNNQIMYFKQQIGDCQETRRDCLGGDENRKSIFDSVIR